MSLPGFSAVSSLYVSARYYCSVAAVGPISDTVASLEFRLAPFALGRVAPFALGGRRSAGILPLDPINCEGCNDYMVEGCSGYSSCGAKGGTCCDDEMPGCCDPGKECCGTECIGFPEICCYGNVVSNPQTDANNCGNCGTQCDEGSTCCDGVCTDVTSDPNHCWQCMYGCPPGDLCCNSFCTKSDNNNCGTCGRQVGPGQSCVNGQVQCTDVSRKACGQDCVDKLAPCCGGLQGYDPSTKKCCGNKTVCDKSDSCCGDKCSCPSGKTCCWDKIQNRFHCVDLRFDNLNCGACGNVCPNGRWDLGCLFLGKCFTGPIRTKAVFP